jgi:Fanconi anemia group M protein
VQLIGLTASPGSDRKKIGELVNVLGIEDIEIRVSTDPDVAPYVMGKQVAVEYVEKGNVIDSIRGILKPVIDIHIGNLFKRGLVYTRDFEKLPKRVLLEVGDNINKIQAVNYRFAAFFDYVYVLNLVHAYDLLSTEGLYSFISYFDSLNAREKKSRAVKSILSDGEVSKALRLAKDAEADGDEHPKMFKLAEIVGGTFRGKSVIVFAQYRSTIKKIAEVLVKNGIKAAVFIGKGEGITQSKQKQVIDEFRNRNFDVLVATSIGEEGLDIPSVDAVIFYEPIPSEIRNIQRKGRAGRVKFGDVVILVTVGTKDEAYLMVSRIKERRMKDLVMKMKNELAHRALSDRYNSSQRKL